jgi:hypothetical protein
VIVTKLEGRLRSWVGTSLRRVRGRAAPSPPTSQFDNTAIAAVIHFDRGCLSGRRISVGALREAVSSAEARFPKVQRFYLLSDDPRAFAHPKVVPCAVDDLESIRDPGEKVFLLAFESDERMRSAVDRIRRLDRAFYFGADQVYPATRYMHTDEAALSALRIAERRISEWSPHFYVGDSENLVQAIGATRRLEGDYLEIGVFQGKSAIVALEYMKQAGLERECWFLDTFEGFAYEQAARSADALYYGTHTETSLEQIRNRLSGYERVHVEKCDVISDPLPASIKRCALVNIDVDMYEATAAALRRAHPLMVSGGIMMVEDYGHTPLILGAQLAVHQFLDSEPGRSYTPIYLRSGYIFLTRHS